MKLQIEGHVYGTATPPPTILAAEPLISEAPLSDRRGLMPHPGASIRDCFGAAELSARRQAKTNGTMLTVVRLLSSKY